MAKLTRSWPDFPINQTPAYNQYISAAGQTEFSFTFPIFERKDIQVWRGDPNPDPFLEPLNNELLTEGTSGFNTYAIPGEEPYASGGTIILNEPGEANKVYTLLLANSYERATKFYENNPIQAQAVNYELNKTVQMIQQLAREMDRTVRIGYDGDPADLLDNIFDAKNVALEAAQDAETAKTNAQSAVSSSAAYAGQSAQSRDQARQAALEAEAANWPRPTMIDNTTGTSDVTTLYAKVKAARLVADAGEILSDREFGTDAIGKIAMGNGASAWADLADLRGGGGGNTPAPSDVDPEPDGTASPGTGTAYSRGDHVHPVTSQWPALSILIMPCALTEADALGWTLQGGQVTNAMSPQLYQRILTEYNAGDDLSDEVVISNRGGTYVTATIICRRSASTGLKIVDVANRDAVDDLYGRTGSAFYIVLDQANAVFYLPRFNDGITFTGDISHVGVYGKDQIVNIDGMFGSGHSLALFQTNNNIEMSGPFRAGTRLAGTVGGSVGSFATNASFDASLVVNTGDRVQGRNVKLFAYFRTGDRVVNAQDIDFGEIQAALNLKSNADLSNVTGVHGFLVDAWISSDGLSWYRKYDDGWIEQAGFISSGTAQTVTLPMPFTTTSYKVYGNVTTGGGALFANLAYTVYATDKTTTTMTLKGYSSAGGGTATQAFDWYAVGY